VPSFDAFIATKGRETLVKLLTRKEKSQLSAGFLND